MVRRVIESFHPRRQPWITRQSYAHELINALSFPVALAMIDAGVMGVLATKLFRAPPYLYALLMAAPMFANLTSMGWTRLARGRSKVHTITYLQIGLLAAIAAVALLPVGWPGALLLTGIMILSRCLFAGIVTLRSTVWRMNYPRNFRATVTGRLILLRTVIIGIAPLVGYALLDVNTNAFRIVYPAAAAVGLVGVTAFARIRLRRERGLLDFERDSTPASPPSGSGDQAALTSRTSLLEVLRRDVFFRNYMFWQFMGGASNMMGQVVAIKIIADLTAGLPGQYVIAICLATALPMGLAVFTLPRWAAYLDRTHIVEFRCRQGWFWVIHQLMIWVALSVLAMTGVRWAAFILLGLAQALHGCARGGGMLAFNLGHNDFAKRQLVALYMGINQTLSGIRGAVMPFVAMALYTGWNVSHFPLAVQRFMPDFTGMGRHVFLITTALAVISELGFIHMRRTIRSRK